MGHFFRAFIAVLVLITAPAMAEPAPAFSLADSNGQQVNLSDYAGKPVILHFWASWCPACKMGQPGLQALAEQHADQQVVLLGVNFAEDEGVDPQQVLSSRGLSFRTLVKGKPVVELYGVKGTPTTFFITREGEVAGISNAYKPEDPELRDMLARIL
ncbi:TlpA family protein disulfide reductase [Seongchinamella unica]|uniref:TlpA family protein disulfide reductase n=1 Tax=Seongchinamella unica TaxID=2547392 RepID=A0A4R5LVB1_9GAMM|nr:TlpA disulfide reductase family protein [Seongchinamella unica]TDG15386.1 TlpA family protein disulfide reductase [Seongchinamella unica]